LVEDDVKLHENKIKTEIFISIIYGLKKEKRKKPVKN
jgi:hypothetical protein